METKHLTYFKVENFKRFDSLEVKDIGQFNLIVGDNNVGKTSLLEALLFDEEDYNQFLFNLWNSLSFIRKITIKTKAINYLDYFLNKPGKPINFHYKYSKTDENYLLLNGKRRDQLTSNDIENLNGAFKVYPNAMYIAEFSLNGEIQLKFIDEFATFLNPHIPFLGFNSLYDDDLIDLFSKFTISTQKREQLISELKYFIPNLVSIEINSGAIVPNANVIVIRESNQDFPKPLSQYGDGVIKLFRYLLEMDLHENKRLMIDEIDTGIHYSRLQEYLKKVLQSAKNKNVQIFATTHSKECIQYYTEALKELNMQDSGRIIRLADTKIGTRAYTMGFEEFENAMDAESEIR